MYQEIRKRKGFSRVKHFLLDLFFPITCFGCDKSETHLCFKCFKRLKFLEHDNLKLLEKNNLSAIFIAGNYQNKLLAKLIIAFKYNNIKGLGYNLAQFLNFFWEGKIKTIEFRNKKLAASFKDILVVPIPLSKKRMRERSFNQSEILAYFFCQEFSYQLFLGLKRKATRRNQAQLRADRRKKNIKDSFFCDMKDLRMIRSRNVLLIDDVITTGATLNEAAATLLSLGAKKVYALVLARA